MYYAGLVATYDDKMVNGTKQDKDAYLERWNYFVKFASECELQFDSSKRLTIKEDLPKFDITKNHPGMLLESKYERYGDWWNKT